MKLKNIEGLLPEGVVTALFYPYLTLIAEKELEIDVEKVRHIIDNTVLGTDELATLKIKDFYPKGTGKRIAQAIAKEFPIKVKEVEE